MAAQAQSESNLSPMQVFEARLAEVRTEFLESLTEQQQEMGDLFARIQDGNRAHEALGEIKSQAHKIRGIAATLGFPDLGKHAAGLEDTIAKFANPEGDQDKLAALFVQRFQSTIAEMARIAD